MKKVLILFVLFLLLLGAAYVAGMWPERTRRSTLESEKAQLSQRAEAAEARVRVGALVGELLTLEEVTREMNYGQARGLSSPLFDRVQAEAARTTDGGMKASLQSVLALRDPV